MAAVIVVTSLCVDIIDSRLHDIARGVASLDLKGRPPWEIKFYSRVYFLKKKIIFCI